MKQIFFVHFCILYLKWPSDITLSLKGKDIYWYLLHYCYIETEIAIITDRHTIVLNLASEILVNSNHMIIHCLPFQLSILNFTGVIVTTIKLSKTFDSILKFKHLDREDIIFMMDLDMHKNIGTYWNNSRKWSGVMD